MKSLKSLGLGLLAATAMTGAASAAPLVIHIAGSTAYRQAATAAIVDYLENGNTSTPIYAGYTGSSLLGCDGEILANGVLPTTANPNPSGEATIVVETYWTGSLAGLVDLVAGNASGAYPDYTDNTNAGLVNAHTVTASGNYGGSTGGVLLTGATVTAAPDMVFSDSVKTTIQKELISNSQVTPSTTLPGGYASISALAAACAGSTVIDAGTAGNAKDAGLVGIVPFVWVVGKNSPLVTASTVPNMSQQGALGLISSGYLSASSLDGNPADTADYYYLLGRNEDSGTRIGAFAESQEGVTSAAVKQFVVPGTYGPTGGKVTYTTYGLFPVTPLFTEPSIEWNAAGHSGFVKGGDVAAGLEVGGGSLTFTSGKSPDNSGNSYFLGYLGLADAQGALGKGCRELNYGGVPFTVGAVEGGQYTFWTYEHCYHLSSLTGTKQTACDTIADDIYNGDADINNSTGQHDNLPTSTTAPGIRADLGNTNLDVYRSTTEGGSISFY